jgi:hypothetical protein
VLIREICNEIIRQCMGQVQGAQIRDDMKEKTSVKSALTKVN